MGCGMKKDFLEKKIIRKIKNAADV